MLASYKGITLKIQEIAHWRNFVKRIVKCGARYEVGTVLKS